MPVFRSVDEALQAVAQGAREVNLTSVNIDDAGACRIAEALATNANLQVLLLDINTVGDAGAVALAEALTTNNSLRVLGLGASAVGDAGAVALAQALKRNTGLKQLFLYGNRVGDEGARELAEALKCNASLKELHLDSNSIRDPGARALLEALTYNDSLTELDVMSNLGISQDLRYEIKALITRRNEERCIVLQVTTMPSRNNEINKAHGLDLAVTKLSGEQVFNQPLQTVRTLRDVAVKVAVLCEVPLASLRWVLPGPRTFGIRSLDEPLMQLLQGGPPPVEPT